MPWRRKWLLIPVFLHGESHGQRSLAAYSPWVCEVRNEWATNTSTFTFCVEQFLCLLWSCGHKSHWLWEVDVLGCLPQLGVLQAGMLNVGSNPFTSQGEAGRWEFSPNCMGLWLGSGLQQKCVSVFPTHFDMVTRVFPASGGDGIPVELFQILIDDAVKVLHSICQQV